MACVAGSGSQKVREASPGILSYFGVNEGVLENGNLRKLIGFELRGGALSKSDEFSEVAIL